MTLYHGAHSATAGHSAHEGMCLTDDRRAAEVFAGSRGTVYSAEVDLGSLVVEDCEGYDHGTDDAPADRAAFRAEAAARGVDVLRYEDEDARGWASVTCYRLCSPRALAAVILAEVE